MNFSTAAPHMSVLWFIIILCTCNSGCSKQRALDLSNLPQLESLLISDTKNIEKKLEDALKESTTFNQLLQVDDKASLLAMTANTQHPLVSLAAWHVIRHKFTEDATLAATNVVLNSEWATKDVMDNTKEFLTKHKRKSDLHLRLDEIATGSLAYKKTNLIVAAQVFSQSSVLSEWFEGYSGKIKQPWLSIILGEIYPLNNERKITAKMEQALNSCSSESGYPLYTYLVLAKKGSDEYVARLVTGLEDKGISDMEFGYLASLNKALIRERIDLKDLKVSEVRKEIITRTLVKE